jgi:hypothetical protein
MRKMESPLASCAPEEDIVDIVNASHVNMGDRICTAIFHALLLFFLRGKTLPQWVRHYAIFHANGTPAQMRGYIMFAVRAPKASAALQNEVPLVNLCDKMLSAAARTKALLMKR